jgi:hypothetical protein
MSSFLTASPSKEADSSRPIVVSLNPTLPLKRVEMLPHAVGAFDPQSGSKLTHGRPITELLREINDTVENFRLAFSEFH